jgi:hypothetical protein
MKQRTLRSALAFVLPLVVTLTPAMAKAPDTQYGDFDEKSPTIKDNFTKLEWQRSALTGADSAGYTSSSNLTACASPFRIPTVKEFLSIVDEEPHWYQPPMANPVLRAVDPNAFPGLPVDLPYWVSSGEASSTLVYLTSEQYLRDAAARNLAPNIVPGQVFNVSGSAHSGYVLCVRNMP